MSRRLLRAPILLSGAAALALLAGCAQPGGSGATTAKPAPEAYPTADVPISDSDKALIQASLNKLGYDAGPVDGFIGRKSRAAIRAYQADIGAPADGFYSPALVERLKADAGPVAVTSKPEAVQAPKPVPAPAPAPAPAPEPEPEPEPEEEEDLFLDEGGDGGGGGGGGGGGW